MITHPQDKVGAIRNPEGIWINTEVFSEEAKHFRRYGRYSDAQPGTMAYKEYWDEQLKRRTEGYTVGGARITGAHYDYLNFCPIKRINEAEAKGVSVAKKRDFPDFWDYDYNYFHSVNIGRFGITQEELDKLQLEVTPKCLKGGHHMIIAKTRRRGFSYKGACLANNAYDTVRSALILLTAFEKTYLSPKGVLAMFNSQMSHIDAHTAFAKRREFNNTAYHKRASYRKIINGTPTEAGFLSEMMGLSFKDNPDASRGGDAYLVLMDEAGEWPGLEQAYKVLQPLCEDGMYVTGQICVFGCVCAGTKVWTKNGRRVNIEDLKKEDGILGYDNQKVSIEPITHFNPPFNKPCYRITTNTGRTLECSEDHPILWSQTLKEYRVREYEGEERIYKGRYKKAEWKVTKDIKKGDQVAVLNALSVFGDRKLWEPRLLGLLVGDGSYGFDKTPILSNSDKGVIDYIESRFDTVTESERLTKTGTTYKEIRIRGICPNLREVGIYGQTKGRKTIPPHIDECDKQTVCEFLGGFFDADGHVAKHQINLSSAYKNLMLETKDLLLKIGVHGSILKVEPNLNKIGGIKDVNPYYRLTISDIDSITNFCKNIKLLAEHKQQALSKLLDKKTKSRKAKRTVFVERSEEHKSYVNLTDVEGVKFETVRSIEYIGIKPVYNLTAGNTHTYIANGIVTHNTGGSMESGSVDFAKMFYDPEPYNFLAFENIWDDEGEGDKVGYYVPDFKNKVGFIDSQGNSDIIGARAYEEEKRNILLASGKKEAYNQHIQEYSFMPAESFLITGDNRFPIKNLRRAKQRLEKSGMYKGVPFTFKVDGDAVGYSPDLSNALTPLYKYAGIIKDNKGAPVMFSAPKPGQTYKIGYDTIHQEQGESLAGIQVYLDSPLTANHNRVEACFYGRSTGPDGCDEIAYNFSRLYNMAEVMHENMFLTTKNNFKRWKAEDLLASQPDLLIKNIIKDSKVERQYGVHMTDKIKLEACLIGARILEAVIGFEEDGTPIMYLDTIRDLRLLEELIRFNFTGNFDAVMAFLMRCIHDEEQTLQKIASNPNTKGIGTELEELRNFRNVKGY